MDRQNLVACNCCGFGKHLTIGWGMGYSSLENVIDLIPDTLRSHVQSILEDHRIEESQNEHRIYECPHCGELRRAFWARIVYEADHVFETTLNCPRCQTGMEAVTHLRQLHGKPCPRCGRQGLVVQSADLWG